LFLCDEFNARRALEIGFVQEIHPFGRHKERAMEIAHLICKNAPIGIRATKEAALQFISAGEAAAIAAIPEIKKKVFDTEDFKEGIQSFIERREAVFQGR
jgi:enoyl-CoA hydratase